LGAKREAASSARGVGRKRRLWVWVLSWVVALVLGYFVVVIGVARLRTPELVARAFVSVAEPVLPETLGEARIQALLRVEDPGFFEHHGVDTETAGAGFTTLTQSLAKHLYFDDFAPGLGKVSQSLLARFALDPLVSKQEQLRLFLNTAYLGTVAGRDVRGFGQAAHIYYGKAAAQLSEEEYLALVAMLVAPKTYHVRTAPEANRERVARIRRLLAGQCQPDGVRDTALEGCRR
jgi:membrane peptidoglycan carboxypeptidase